MRSVAGHSYTIGPAGATLYPASGGSDDWYKGGLGVKYAYTLEMRDTGRHGFVLPASQIIETAREGWEFTQVLAKYVYNS